MRIFLFLFNLHHTHICFAQLSYISPHILHIPNFVYPSSLGYRSNTSSAHPPTYPPAHYHFNIFTLSTKSITLLTCLRMFSPYYINIDMHPTYAYLIYFTLNDIYISCTKIVNCCSNRQYEFYHFSIEVQIYNTI